MAQKNPTCSSKDIVLHTQPKKQQTTKQHFVSRIRMQRADSAPAELKAGATSIRPKLRPTIDRMESAPLEPTELPPSPGKVKTLSRLPGNHRCADCPAMSPAWASLSHGTLICHQCSGLHRALGVERGRVKSLFYDEWVPSEMKRMEVGGNGALRAFFASVRLPHHPFGDIGEGRGLGVAAKYSSVQAEFYRRRLDALSADRPMPTDEPPMFIPSTPVRPTERVESDDESPLLPSSNSDSDDANTGSWSWWPFSCLSFFGSAS